MAASAIWCTVPLVLFSVPVRNGNRVTGELSRGNELPDSFLDRSCWVEFLQEETLQRRQYLYYPFRNEPLIRDGECFCNDIEASLPYTVIPYVEMVTVNHRELHLTESEKDKLWDAHVQ